MAVKAEREATGEKPKRKRHYTGNSDRTKWHHTQKCRELGTTGQNFISSMFSKKAKEPTTCATEDAREKPSLEIINIADDDDEIEASLKQLFPSEHKASSFEKRKQKKSYQFQADKCSCNQ
jgi:hypothetical protein